MTLVMNDSAFKNALAQAVQSAQTYYGETFSDRDLAAAMHMVTDKKDHFWDAEEVSKAFHETIGKVLDMDPPDIEAYVKTHLSEAGAVAEKVTKKAAQLVASTGKTAEGFVSTILGKERHMALTTHASHPDSIAFGQTKFTSIGVWRQVLGYVGIAAGTTLAIDGAVGAAKATQADENGNTARDWKKTLMKLGQVGAGVGFAWASLWQMTRGQGHGASR